MRHRRRRRVLALGDAPEARQGSGRRHAVQPILRTQGGLEQIVQPFGMVFD